MKKYGIALSSSFFVYEFNAFSACRAFINVLISSIELKGQNNPVNDEVSIGFTGTISLTYVELLVSVLLSNIGDLSVSTPSKLTYIEADGIHSQGITTNIRGGGYVRQEVYVGGDSTVAFGGVSE